MVLDRVVATGVLVVMTTGFSAGLHGSTFERYFELDMQCLSDCSGRRSAADLATRFSLAADVYGGQFDSIVPTETPPSKDVSFESLDGVNDLQSFQRFSLALLGVALAAFGLWHSRRKL